MRLYSMSEGWETMRRDLRFTRAMLVASKTHEALARPLDTLCTQWAALDVERRDASDALTDANARVAFLDLRLDEATTRFAAQLLADADGKREHPTFRAFFPDAPTELIRMGLGSQVEASARLHQVATEVRLSQASMTKLNAMAAIEEETGAALTAREEAAVAQTRVSLRVQAWRENANGARRSVHTALHEHANRNGLPREYPEAFFPSARAPKKPGRTPPSP